jgi:hypothetical protein
MSKLCFARATVSIVCSVLLLQLAPLELNSVKVLTAVAAATILPIQSEKFTLIEPTGEYRDAVFSFSTPGKDYTIAANGQVSTVVTNAQKKSFKLDVDEGFIEKLSFMEYKGDLLLLAELSDHDSGWGSIYSLSSKNSRLNWKAHIPGFNIGEALIEKNHAYITAIGFVAKVNLKNGRYIWKNQDLYKRSDSFNNFAQPQIKGRKVIFRGEAILAKVQKSVVVDKISGKILAIE